MVDGMNGMLVCCSQSERIKEYPVDTGENLIVVDNLEAGKLKFFKYTGGSLNIRGSNNEI